MGSFQVTYPVGGIIDEIKKIDYPAALVPDVNYAGTKGFRIAIDEGMPSGEAKCSFGMDINLSEINISCSEYDDGDFWELDVGDIKLCETMYIQELPGDAQLSSGFAIYPLIPANTEIKFTFTNNSGVPKKIWISIGYMYKR